MSGNTIAEVARNYGLRLAGRLEENLEFEAPTFAFEGTMLWDVSLGAYTTISQGTDIVRTRIGRYCSIGAYCIIGAGSHPTDRITTSSLTYTPGPDMYQQSPFSWFGPGTLHEPWHSQRLVEIGHDVFIGSRAVILEGVKIGIGAVIGAGAVVVKDVDPYEIVAGVPAKPIRKRFEASVADRLQKLRWWEFDLRLWVNEGTLPKTSNLNHAILDRIEDAILNGNPPRLINTRSRIYRGEDRSWRFETGLRP